MILKPKKKVKIEGWSKGLNYGVRVVEAVGGHVYRSYKMKSDCLESVHLELAGAVGAVEDWYREYLN